MTTELTDDEREAHIRDCGKRMQEAYNAGNKQEAEYWMLAQNQAIAARSPEQVKRMEIARGLAGTSCFFDTQGELDRDTLPAILRRQAA